MKLICYSCDHQILFQSDAEDAADYGLVTDMDEDEQKNQNIVITAAELVNIHAVLDLYIVSVCEH